MPHPSSTTGHSNTIKSPLKPHLCPYWGGGGVVGHTVDRCIMHTICQTYPAFHLLLFPLACHRVLVLLACHLLLVPLVYHRVLIPLVQHHAPQHGEESGRGNKAKNQGRERNIPAEFVADRWPLPATLSFTGKGTVLMHLGNYPKRSGWEWRNRIETERSSNNTPAFLKATAVTKDFTFLNSIYIIITQLHMLITTCILSTGK